jgi:hypothetical protein
MYTIINKTTSENFKFTGNYPIKIVEHMLNNGDEIIIISTYSNTIKIPVGLSQEFIGEWEWKEFTYSPDMF